MKWLIIGSIVPSFLLTWLFGYVLRRYAPGWGFVDQSNHERNGGTGIPTGGGLAIWAGVVLPFAAGTILLEILSANSIISLSVGLEGLWEFVAPHLSGLAQQTAKLWILLSCATLLMLLGLADDRWNLDWRLRITIQTLIACLMVWQGWRLSFFVDLPVVTIAASVLWIVGLINTFNMLDNMDGLAAGIAAIVATILAAVILTASGPVSSGPQLFVGGFLLVFLGAVLGFLWHNAPPAKLFMGDAGSYFVGFCIATATISATFSGESTPEYAILAPLCVLAIPLYDTVTVIWIRCREGRSLFEGDTSHISHRLVEAGMSRKGAVYTLYLATVVCGFGAFALHLVDSRGAVMVLFGIGSLLFLIGYWELGVRRRQQQRKVDTANGPPE